VKPKYYHSMIPGPALALWCEVLGGYSQGGLPSLFVVLRLTAGPHTFTTAVAILRHICTHLNHVVSQNLLAGVDRQHESREAQSLYPSGLRFVGCATWPIPGQEGVWYALVSFLYKQTYVNINPSRSCLSGWLLYRLWGADGNPA
jgi:hypothetical protein